MSSPALAAMAALVWPWGPPGSQWPDAIAGYGSVLLLIALIVWTKKGHRD